MDRGGAEMRTLELMPLVAEKGVHFDFCAAKTGPGQLDEKIRVLGGHVIVCQLKPRIFRFALNFVKLLRQSDYDIVHSHGHLASGYILWLAHKAGIKGRIAHFRSIGDGKRVTLKRKIYHYVMRRLIDRHATAILAVCRGAMEHGWKRQWQNDPRCRIIYNGLDLSAYEQTPVERKQVRAEFDLKENTPLLINVGRFHPPKAHDILMAAARKVTSQNPSIHFLLVGDGELKNAMQATAQEYEIVKNVHFAGLRYDVPRLLKAADAFVLSSRREGLPGVVLEAVAANLPIVATDLPGVREIAEHTDLIRMVPCENSPALAEEILKTYNEVVHHKIEKQPFPPEFDLHRCAENLLEVYQQQWRP